MAVTERGNCTNCKKLSTLSRLYTAELLCSDCWLKPAYRKIHARPPDSLLIRLPPGPSEERLEALGVTRMHLARQIETLLKRAVDAENALAEARQKIVDLEGAVILALRSRL